MKIFKNSAIYTAGYILSRLQNFIFLPILTRALPPADVGAIETLAAFSFFITVAVVFNLDACVSSNYNELKDSNDRRELFWTALATSFSFSILAIFVTLMFKGTLLDLLQIDHVNSVSMLFLVAVVSTIISAWNHIFHVLLRVKFFSKQYSFLLILNTSLNLGVSYALVRLYQNPMSIIAGGFIANLITFACTVYLSRDMFPIMVSFKKWSNNFTKIALPLLPYSLFAWTLSMADRSILASFRSLTEVGLYSVLVKISALTGVLLGPFQIAWMPFAMKAWTDGKQAIFKIAYGWLCLGISLLILSLGFISKPLVQILAGTNYAEIAPFVVPMSLCNVLNILFYFPLVSFMHKKKMYASSISFGFGALSNIVVNFTLVPNYGLKGAVLANISSYILMYVTAIVFEKKQTNVGYAYIRSGLLFVMTICLYMANDQLMLDFGTPTGIFFFISASAALVFLAWITKLIDFKILNSLLKSLKNS